MNDHQKRLASTAAVIDAIVRPVETVGFDVALPSTHWRKCEQLASQIAKAEQHGWYGAVKRLRQQLLSWLRIVNQRIDETKTQLETRQTTAPRGTVHEIFHDLVALQSEFDNLEYDRKAGTLAVETEPIMLERGVTHDPEFENWANKVWSFGAGLGAESSLADFRKDIIIEMYNEAGQLAIAYQVFRCWVSEFQALPELEAELQKLS